MNYHHVGLILLLWFVLINSFSRLQAQEESSSYGVRYTPNFSIGNEGFDAGIEIDFPRVGQKSWVLELKSGLTAHVVDRNFYLTYPTAQDIPLLNPARVSGVSWQSYRVKLTTQQLVELTIGRRRWSKTGRTYVGFLTQYAWAKLRSQTSNSPMPLASTSFFSGPLSSGHHFEDSSHWWPQQENCTPNFIVNVSEQTAVRSINGDQKMSADVHYLGTAFQAGWRLFKNRNWSPIISYRVLARYNFGKNSVSPASPTDHEHRAIESLLVSRFRVTQQASLGFAIGQ